MQPNLTGEDCAYVRSNEKKDKFVSLLRNYIKPMILCRSVLVWIKLNSPTPVE
jgi:hypothetical protein